MLYSESVFETTSSTYLDEISITSGLLGPTYTKGSVGSSSSSSLFSLLLEPLEGLKL